MTYCFGLTAGRSQMLVGVRSRAPLLVHVCFVCVDFLFYFEILTICFFTGHLSSRLCLPSRLCDYPPFPNVCHLCVIVSTHLSVYILTLCPLSVAKLLLYLVSHSPALFLVSLPCVFLCRLLTMFLPTVFVGPLPVTSALSRAFGSTVLRDNHV